MENANNYENTQLIFCNIDNIHVMRSSFALLGDVVLPSSYNEADLNLHAKLDETGWLKYMRLILASSVQAGNIRHV